MRRHQVIFAQRLQVSQGLLGTEQLQVVLSQEAAHHRIIQTYSQRVAEGLGNGAATIDVVQSITDLDGATQVVGDDRLQQRCPGVLVEQALAGDGVEADSALQ